MGEHSTWFDFLNALPVWQGVQRSAEEHLARRWKFAMFDATHFTLSHVLGFFCVALFLIPRTAVLGAVLIAGYLGGAIATHVRIGEPFFIQAALGVVMWLGLYLRDPRLRALIPLRTPAAGGV